MRRLTIAALLLASAAGATFVIHARTLGYGFHYDDYHFIHPYPRAEVTAAFRGPWDASGIELPYYRPLTIAFFAARFEMLGMNAAAHHALSLILVTLAAFLTGWFVYRLTGRATAGLLAVTFFAAHPALPYALVAWVTNQMHLLETVLVLMAFCWWDAVRRRPVVWWLPLLLLAAAAFLIKEDGIMLLPSIVVVHLVRRQFGERDLPRPPWTFIALAVLTVAALLWTRNAAVGAAVSRRVPSLAAGWHNYWTGLYRVFCLAPAHRPWQVAASRFAIGVPLAAVALWRRAAAPSRAALVCGVGIALLFNLPFVFVTKPEQLHLVTVGAVVVIAAALRALLDAVRAAAGRVGILAVAAAGAAACAAVTINITRDFEPFGPIVLGADTIVRGWAAVPEEIREYLAQKRVPGAAQRLSPNPAEAVERITFGVHGRESSAGVPFQWMSGRRSELLLSPDAHTVAIPIRHALEIFRQPAEVTVTADGRLVDRMDLTTPEWRVSSIAMPTGRATGWFGMHRVVIQTGNAWTLATVSAGSADGRTLGLQIGQIRITSSARHPMAAAR